MSAVDTDAVRGVYGVLALLLAVSAVFGVADYRSTLVDDPGDGVDARGVDCPDDASASASGGASAADADSGASESAAVTDESRDDGIDCGDTVATTGAS